MDVTNTAVVVEATPLSQNNNSHFIRVHDV